jgi:hypothetical protein
MNDLVLRRRVAMLAIADVSSITGAAVAAAAISDDAHAIAIAEVAQEQG